MNRLPRFEGYRFIGERDTMIVYDCDQPDEFEILQAMVGKDDLLGRKLLQSFAPDTIDEAKNRGFHPSRRARVES